MSSLRFGDMFSLEGRRTGSPLLWFLLALGMYLFVSSLFYSIAVNSLSLGLIGITWLLIMIAERRWGVARTPLDIFFAAYVLAECISTLFSVNPQQSLVFSKRLLLISVVYLFPSVVTTVGDLRRVFTVLLGTAVLVATLGVLKLIFGDPAENIRLGIFQFYMTTSELMMMSTLLLLPFVVHSGTPLSVRIVSAIACIPVVISLYATVTRGAYLAVAGGALFLALVRNRKLVVPILLLLALLTFVSPAYIGGRIASIVDLHHPENATRIMLWTTGIKIFLDHPVVGVGDIDLYAVMVRYVEPGTTMTWGHVHNVLIQILATLGLLGFLAVTALFVRMFMVQWQTYRIAREDWFLGSVVLGALSVFVGFQINGLTEWSFGDQEVVLLLWTTMGMVLSVRRIVDTQRRTQG